MKRLLLLIFVVLLLLFVFRPTEASHNISARTLLNELPVRGPHDLPYDRDQLFGDFDDADGDGCDTRVEVLLRDRISGTKSANDLCQLVGEWKSLYDNVLTSEASDLQIDHMVPLKEAWISGANEWGEEKRSAFTNDLGFEGSLIAVTGRLNQSKGESDPASWLPPSTSYHCRYVVLWSAVKWRWDLSVDENEKKAILEIMDGCSKESILVSDVLKAN